MKFDRLAMVARWKPPHLGHQRVLCGLLSQCRQLTLGIGSANRYDRENPFRAGETEDMLRLILPDSVPILKIEDLGDPPRWAAQLASRLGRQDAFVTANPWVAEWMEPYYPILHPVRFVAPELRIALNASMVRQAWRDHKPWEQWVSPEMAEHLRTHGLVERYQREFA